MSEEQNNLAALMPWELFRGPLGENVDADGTTIRAVLWFRDMVNPMGRQYQYLELEVGLDTPLVAEKSIGQHTRGPTIITTVSPRWVQRFRVTEELQTTYPNSRRYRASNETV